MSTISILRRVAVAGVAAAAVMLGGTVTAEPAQAAEGNWDAPPTCFDGAEWHYNNYNEPDMILGLYDHQGQIEERRYYGGGYEVQYYWVYTVSVPGMTGPNQYGMMDVGVAYKLCGSTWHPNYA